MNTQRRASRPRFRRVEELASIALTDDDAAIMRHLKRHRFVRTTDLYRLMTGRSADKVSRRLARLYRAGYVDRPIAQIDSFRGKGSQALVYGLDNRGETYLAALDGDAHPKGDLRSRNRAYTRENLDHTLATASFMIDVEVACRTAPNVEFIRPEEVLGAGSKRALRWPVSLPWQGHRADVLIAPDALFGLRVTRDNATPLRSYYIVEMDRGHMTIAPSEHLRRSEAFLYRSSVLRKFLAYAVSHTEGQHQEQLGIPSARVLFLTTSQSRADEMRAAAQRLVLPHLDVSPGLFLFAPVPAGEGVLDSWFAAGDGSPTRLLPESAGG